MHHYCITCVWLSCEVSQYNRGQGFGLIHLMFYRIALIFVCNPCCMICHMNFIGALNFMTYLTRKVRFIPLIFISFGRLKRCNDHLCNSRYEYLVFLEIFDLAIIFLKTFESKSKTLSRKRFLTLVKCPVLTFRLRNNQSGYFTFLMKVVKWSYRYHVKRTLAHASCTIHKIHNML